jgi:hypothetical protein
VNSPIIKFQEALTSRQFPAKVRLFIPQYRASF